MADAGEPDLVRDLGDGGGAARQELLGALEPGAAQVAVRREAGDRAEQAAEVERAGVGLLAGPGLRQAILATALLIGVPGAVGLRLRSLGTARTDPATAGRD